MKMLKPSWKILVISALDNIPTSIVPKVFSYQDIPTQLGEACAFNLY